MQLQYKRFLNLYFDLLQLPGLTKETFLALRQTCLAIAGLAKYLLNQLEFKYVLPGKIQSDNIEGRFRRIRQLSGANYFISMRQLYESDRKLRAISLLKYSNISITDVEHEVKDKKTSNKEIITKAESIQAELLFNILPTDNDTAIIYYVTGYCCRSLVKNNKCNYCKQAMVATIEHPSEFEENVKLSNNAIAFFDSINRGGLWKPTLELFKVGLLCWRTFAEILQSSIKKSFLNTCYHRKLFSEIISISFYEENVISTWTVPAYCTKGHDILDGISQRFFNCMCKNMILKLSQEDSRKVYRKIQKLSGKKR